MRAPLHSSEAARLNALHGCGILDTPPEPAYERIARLASRMLGMPVAAISFVDRERQWFKARVGLDIGETPREISFCAHAIHEDKILVVPDATADPRFADNTLVTGEMGIRFYAGAPLCAPGGLPLGTLCVLDRRPRRFNKNQRQILADLAALVLDELSLRGEIHARHQAEAELREQHASLHTLHESVERRVVERTVELTAANSALHSEIHRRGLGEDALRAKARQQEALVRFGRDVLSGGSVDELLCKTVRLIGETLDVEWCRALEHLVAEKSFVVRASLDPAGMDPDEINSKDDPSSSPGYVLRTGEPVLIRDTDGDARFELPPILRRRGIKSAICVLIGSPNPSVWHFGVLTVATRKPCSFTEEDVIFLQSVTNVLAAAIARRRQEDALRVVEARYQRIAANTPGVVYQYLLRPGGTVAVPFISESCRAIYGREAAEIQADPQIMLDCVHPDDRADFVAAVHQAKSTLTPLNWQGRHLLPDGEVRWMRVDSRPDQLPDGGVICDGIVIDITGEKRQREALQQSEERFRLAILHSPFPVMLHASDGEILKLNHAWTHMTGYTEDVLHTMEDWITRAYGSEPVRREIRNQIADLTSRIGVSAHPGQQILCVDGGERVWDFTHANLDRMPDGRWLHITSAVDVTERLQGEADLLAAKEEAERANRAKSGFLSRMSHELRTPLNAILGFGQLLEFSPLGAQETASLNYIMKGARHLLVLIDEVLDLSRAETGELHLSCERVDVGALARECVGLVTRLSQARGITCQVLIPRQALLWVDEQRLRQMLLNLLSNAIKYNREGGQVLVTTEVTSTGWLRLKVNDTGPGIPPEGLTRLFVPFERLEQEFVETEGTGLGLVISRRIAEAMGGTVGVDSEVGRGSTFWIELPLAAPPRGASHGRRVRSPEPDVAQAILRARLLYVEDHLSNLEVVKALLANCRPRWDFLSARDGVEGLQLAREEAPDVILLDLQLPGMKGDEVLAELRRGERTKHIPVILLSADATSHSRERLLRHGADEYVSKPFKVDHLLQLLDRALAKVSQKQDHPRRVGKPT